MRRKRFAGRSLGQRAIIEAGEGAGGEHGFAMPRGSAEVNVSRVGRARHARLRALRRGRFGRGSVRRRARRAGALDGLYRCRGLVMERSPTRRRLRSGGAPIAVRRGANAWLSRRSRPRHRPELGRSRLLAPRERRRLLVWRSEGLEPFPDAAVWDDPSGVRVGFRFQKRALVRFGRNVVQDVRARLGHAGNIEQSRRDFIPEAREAG